MPKTSQADSVEPKPTKPRNPKTASNARYHANDSRPYTCNLCNLKYASYSSLKRHFNKFCHANHDCPPDAKWDDHPSALSPQAALALPCARPFYPTYYVLHTDSLSGTRTKTLTWPALSGWPTSPAELERKNASHRAIQGSNPHYVDTPENVYADVPSDAEEFVSGEDPWFQLTVLHQCVDGRSLNRLLGLAMDGQWVDGYEDDVLLALVLHNSDDLVRDWLGLDERTLTTWIEQASHNLFTVHVRAASGPNDAKRDSVAVQEERWRGLIERFRGEHVEEGCEGCDRIGIVLREHMKATGDEVDGENEDDWGDDSAEPRESEDEVQGKHSDEGGQGAGGGKVMRTPDSSSGSSSSSSWTD